jgi:hypothetical protein
MKGVTAAKNNSERRGISMAKKNKKQAEAFNTGLQQQDVEFSEEGVAQLTTEPAQKVKKKNKK